MASLILDSAFSLSDPTIIGGIFVGVVAIFAVGKLFLGQASPSKLAKVPAQPRPQVPASSKPKEAEPQRRGVLSPTTYQKFPLKEKIEITHNTKLFRFALPNETDVLGLPIGQHMSLRATIEGKEVYRPYTPTSSDDDLGHFDLIVKVYPQGKMGQYLDHLKIGDTIDVKGPKGQFTYVPGMKRAFGMLAGGTGITPMLQVITAILKNPEDRTQVSLIFANVNEDDILVRERLEELAAKHPDRFKLYFVLNNPPADWKFGTGFITADMIKERCPAPADDAMILMCGPTPMNNAMIANLEKLGYTESMYFKF